MIKDIGSNRSQLLEPELLVGRSTGCGLRIDHRYVSARHAVLRWTGDRWELKDLGSRNGTFVDGQRVRPGEEVPALRGSRIAFGKLEQQWEIIDDSPPSVMAVPLDGGAPILLDGELLALPSADEPRATIYRSTEGFWVLEQSDDGIAPVRNLQTFEVAGRAYRFCSLDNIAKTSIADFSPELEIAHAQLTFSVSRDEEHVELRVTCDGQTFDLGARTAHYLLLVLARRRLADVALGLPETSCGWVYQEDLSADPAMMTPQLNLDVFRIRKQFSLLGLHDAANIIERRPRTRQLRIGTTNITVSQL
jgi:FHA domain